ncbi:MAG: type II toxin-antitoxin system VapC family toxin [bacterium]|nr:type II toxin-antitoxin system VapC family toxin [bacterium]
MTRLVIDASVAVEYLLRTPLGLTLTNTIDDATLLAPELMDAEVLSVLRRAVLRGHLEQERALMAVDDLTNWPVDRVPHRALARLAWEYHHTVSAYDALYMATARAHDLPLLTADGRLARAPNLRIAIHHVQLT